MLLSLYYTEGTSLCTSMKDMLESHSQHFTHLWEGFMGNKQKPRLDHINAMHHFSHLVFVSGFNTPNLFHSVTAVTCVSVKSVWDGAAAVWKQCLYLPGGGALHSKHSTCQVSSSQSMWYCTLTHYISPLCMLFFKMGVVILKLGC